MRVGNIKNNAIIENEIGNTTPEYISEQTNVVDTKWTLIDDYIFNFGECYQFSQNIDIESDHSDYPKTSLYGIYDSLTLGFVTLEVATLDFIHYYNSYMVPQAYKYVQRMSRADIRDFAYNMGYKDGIMADEE